MSHPHYLTSTITTTTTTRANPSPFLTSSTHSQFCQHQTAKSSRKSDNPTFRKGLDTLTTSLNHIGDTIGNAFEVSGVHTAVQQPAQPHMQASQEGQLKASHDLAMATAAKAKLLLRELKTVKADLAFAKQRCSQSEEENRILREAMEKGNNPADDDMIRLQLETLLAEKARLAHENSVYAWVNCFLREIVEYHQLTMQDVVYLDEGIEEVTEVYPIPAVFQNAFCFTTLAYNLAFTS